MSTPSYSFSIAATMPSAAVVNPSACPRAVSSVSPMLAKKVSRLGRPNIPVLIPARTTHVWICPSVASYASDTASFRVLPAWRPLKIAEMNARVPSKR